MPWRYGACKDEVDTILKCRLPIDIYPLRVRLSTSSPFCPRQDSNVSSRSTRSNPSFVIAHRPCSLTKAHELASGSFKKKKRGGEVVTNDETKCDFDASSIFVPFKYLNNFKR